jgi:signal transduction histidine kinase
MIKLLKIVGLLVFLPVMGLAQASYVFDDPEELYFIKNFEFIIDSSESYDISSIQLKKFTELNKSNRSDLQTVNSTWIKLTYRAGEEVNNLSLLIDQANIDTVEFYQLNQQGLWEKTLYGNNLAFDTRKYKFNHFIFDLGISKSEKVVYLRLKNNITTSYNIIAGQQNTILEYEQKGSTMFAVIFGIFAVMIAYNLFLYISIKETVYLIYVIQSFFTALLQAVLFGFSFQYFWPNNMVFQEYGIEFLTTVGTIGGLVFMNVFLRTKKHTPILFKISQVIIAFYVVLGIAVGINNSLVNMILLGLQPIVAIFIFFSAIRVWLKGYEPAKYYLLAWSTFLLGILVFVLAEVGIIERNNYTTLTMTFGAAIEVVLLSFALANRINILKTEQEVAVAKSFSLEKEKASLIQKQNIVLEQKVMERTSQLKKINYKLEDKNQEIELAYSELKNTQSQLVNAEKMSSLGQLTAGIAHEINNPINFVSSNINPLKRDVDDVISIFEETEMLAKKSLPAEEYQKIQALKEDLDYDYVKDEINQLLDGMRDGANRTVEIIKGLKLFSRVDETDLKKVNLEDGLNSTLVLLNSSIKHHLKVTTNFSNIPNVECFGGKMNQVFMNILSNAVQAVISTGREDGEIVVTTTSDEGKVRISISDNGPGMTEEVKLKLFEPFFTTKPVGEGTGLGLSIVYKIVDRINGNIQVNSVINEGTEFIITLPITNITKPPHHD